MSTTVMHSVYLSGRLLRFLRREPVYLAFTLVAPLVWLLLFSQLFERVVDIPGFGDVSYITYLTPGVVIMTAMMNAGWAGTGFIDDMSRGVMDRNLTSPVSRTALLTGTLAYQAVVTIVQSLIVIGIGTAMGARFGEWAGGIAVLLVVAVLVALVFGAVSCAFALLLRSQEALIGMSQFLVLPLMFLSSALMPPDLMPGWVETLASFNPVDWAATAGREALAAGTDWAVVSRQGGLLLGLTVVMAWLATRAFRMYQRSA